MSETKLQLSSEQIVGAHGFPLGVQYYGPPHTNLTDWQRDFPLIKEYGLDAIAVWAIWGHLEPSLGKYDFAEWDRMFDAAQAHGLMIMPVTTIEIQPYWIHRQFPEAYMVDQRGNPIVSTTGEYCGGLSPGACFDHIAPRKQAAKFLTRFSSHFKDRKNLLGYDVWNELRWTDNINDRALQTSDRFPCYCENSVARFREWLKAKYGSLEGLNAQWRHKYSDWVDVYPPRGGWWSYGYPETVDWGQFLAANLIDKLHLRVNAVREGDSKHLIITHTGSPSIRSTEMLCRRGSDDWQNASVVDVYASSIYPAWGPPTQTLAELNCMGLDGIRSAVLARNKQFWISELQGGPSLHSPGKGNNYSAQDLKFWSYCALAHGAKGILYWSWRPEPFGPETLGFGITTFGGVPTARTRMVKEVTDTIKKHNDLFATAQVKPAQIAILFDPDLYNINYYGGTGGMEPDMVLNSMHGYYKALWENDLPCDFIHVADIEDLDSYKLLILPFAFCLHEKAAETIKRFVNTGGVVLSEAYLGRYAEGCIPALTCPTYGLHELFKVQVMEAEFIESERIVSSGNQELFFNTNSLTGYWFKEQVILSENVEVLATFQDGSPALTRSRVGDGQALLFGALIGYGYHKASDRSLAQLLGNLAKLAGVDQPVKVSNSQGGMVKVRIQPKGKDFLVYCLNYGGECHTRLELHLPAPNDIQELVAGEQSEYAEEESAVVIEMTMAARDVKVFLYHTSS